VHSSKMVIPNPNISFPPLHWLSDLSRILYSLFFT
jgi:hypothetical protein